MKSRNKILTEIEILHHISTSTYFYITYYNIKLKYSEYINIFQSLNTKVLLILNTKKSIDDYWLLISARISSACDYTCKSFTSKSFVGNISQNGSNRNSLWLRIPVE